MMMKNNITLSFITVALLAGCKQKETEKPITAEEIKGHIEFKNVTFTYPSK